MNLASITKILLRKISVETEPQNFCFVCKLKSRPDSWPENNSDLNWVGSEGQLSLLFLSSILRCSCFFFLKIALKSLSAKKPWFLHWQELWFWGSAEFLGTTIQYQLLGKAQLLPYKVTPRHFPLMKGVASKVVEKTWEFLEGLKTTKTLSRCCVAFSQPFFLYLEYHMKLFRK